MKVRWREHEMIAVAIVISWQIVLLLIKVSSHSIVDLESIYKVSFADNGWTFNYWQHAFIPQLASLFLIFGVYLLINWWVIPSIKAISGDDFEKLLTKNIAKALLALIVVSFLLTLGVNILTYLARPYLFSYRDYQFLSIVGFNDQGLQNVFFGYGRCLVAVSLVTVIAEIRELIIWLIERPGINRDYRVLVMNNTTPLICIYMLILLYVKPLHYDFVKIQIFISPLIVLYLYHMFSLFPFKGDSGFLKSTVIKRLLIATFICIIPSFLVFYGLNKILIPLIYWLLLLFIATPLFWLIYQQRKDKILQLKNMEKALSHSSANLEFLKSQINPHFLFNSLNTLYGTALKGDIENTAEGIQKLGDMMRFMLHENTMDKIPMEKEVDYLQNYIALQKLRIQSSPDIIIEENIGQAPINCQIAPMLLIPFVENAFKHGISLKDKSWIIILLQFNQGNLHFEVNNSIHKNESNLESGKPSIGLTNVKDRLNLLYPGNYSLEIHENLQEFSIKLALKC